MTHVDINMMITGLMSVILALTLMVNVVVQVIKDFIPKTVPTQLVTLIVAFIVTFSAGAIYCMAQSLQIKLWMLFGCFGLAFAVAFAAMYGFDELKKLITRWQDGP